MCLPPSKCLCSRMRNMIFTHAECSVSDGSLTNYHKLGGLKQQKLILSQFWRPESETSSALRWRGSPSSRALGGIHCLSLPAAAGCWLLAFLGLWPHHCNLSLLSHSLLCVSNCLLLLSYRTCVCT